MTHMLSRSVAMWGMVILGCLLLGTAGGWGVSKYVSHRRAAEQLVHREILNHLFESLGF